MDTCIIVIWGLFYHSEFWGLHLSPMSHNLGKCNPGLCILNQLPRGLLSTLKLRNPWESILCFLKKWVACMVHDPYLLHFTSSFFSTWHGSYKGLLAFSPFISCFFCSHFLLPPFCLSCKEEPELRRRELFAPWICAVYIALAYLSTW